MNDPESTTSFEPQPGATARLDRSHAQREIQRRILLLVPWVRQLDAHRREFVRMVTGKPHVVDFFHQVDDAYSHLAIEAIGPLLGRYDIDFRFHLTSQTDRSHAPEPDLLTAYARRDCEAVAPYYELDFPINAKQPAASKVSRVEGLLAGLTEDPRFLEVAIQAGRALWQGDAEALDQVAERIPSSSDAEVSAALEAGNALRTQRRHYSGGMFWYAGEWYWGVDRLHHLERRLIRFGASKGTLTTPRFDRPPLDPGTVQNDGRLSLEIFPSLRSPYTAMIFDRSMQLAESVGVPVTIRPVLPMVMRGAPVPAAKGFYIMLDTLREAKHIGAPFGNMYDPVGRAVERGFALWPFARDKGRGKEFISAFLKAAFAEGRPTGTDEGLRRVVESAGLSFEEARPALESEAWREELENNRRTMYDELGLWGVPSYRLRGPADEPDLCVWGQDRLWLVAAEIRRRLGSEAGLTDRLMPSLGRRV
jgi:2-hydroxychromene-2-carboxylate isomerase